MRAYYNEFDPYAAQWLRNLISAGLIAPGDVDERSICDVRPEDLRGYTQCHFFAGIGAWSHALRLAGWPDDRPVWTGSCPCQPLSSAGKRKGHADERHLWPAFYGLIAECHPPAVFGEQVASKDGREWFSAVRADLEDAGYACGAADICAAGQGVGWEESQGGEWLRRAIRDCPDPWIADQLRDFADWAGGNLVWGGAHIRQRLWWVADLQSGGRRECGYEVVPRSSRHANGGVGPIFVGYHDNNGCEPWGEGQPSLGHGAPSEPNGGVSVVAHSIGSDCGRETASPDHGRDEEADRPSNWSGGRGCASSGMADACVERRQQIAGSASRDEEADGRAGRNRIGADSHNLLAGDGEDGVPSPVSEFRGTADWLVCRDGKWRPVRPGSFPLAHGASARVGRLRAYGNAIDPQVAAEVIGAYLDIERGVK